MFVGGLVNKFTHWGGQQAVANLVGVDQSTVSRGARKVTSPYPNSSIKGDRTLLKIRLLSTSQLLNPFGYGKL
jgi:hypothetical protein